MIDISVLPGWTPTTTDMTTAIYVTRLSSQARQTHLPLKVKCKGHNFFQIYTFLDSDIGKFT
jgi:hypothetical protein